MNNEIQVGLPTPVSVDEATSKLARWLRDKVVGGGAAFGAGDSYEFAITSLVQQEVGAAHKAQIDEFIKTHERPTVKQDLVTHAAPFYEAGWQLFRRGVLVPVSQHRQGTLQPLTDTFRLTEHGIKWVAAYPEIDVPPTEVGRFSARL